MNFASDNIWGASPPILEALVRANEGPLASYAGDPITRRVEVTFGELFERDCAVLLVPTGTAANALGLAALCPPWGGIVCHEHAHIIADECGAVGFQSGGAMLIGLPGVGGKIAPETLEGVLSAPRRAPHNVRPMALSLTQATESGLVYSLDELHTLSAIAKAHGLVVHMDGARFANALVRLGATPAEASWKAGIDVLSFGATKNGCLAAEAILVFDPVRAANLSERRMRAGHLLSKGRLLAAQLEAYLAGDHWLENARHANAMAERLAAGLAALPGVRLPWPVEANEVFPILPLALDARLKELGAVYHPWPATGLPPGERVGEGEGLFRLVTAFATTPAMVDAFLSAARTAHGVSAAA
jgi:threonine aldolase